MPLSSKNKVRKRSPKQQEALRAIVALSLVPGLGARRLRDILTSCSHPAEIFTFSRNRLKSYEGIGEASALAILSFNRWDEADAIIRQTENLNADMICWSDDNYPPLLKQIYDPPLLLWIKGAKDALSLPGIAVVGTRQPSAYGKKMTRQMSEGLAKAGLCIYSGLAYGIDAIAHKTAIESGTPTVAVLGSGIDTLYPAKHRGLANSIIEGGGAVITEFPPGTRPDAGNFPVRNRIVSGLSLGVLVIESGLKGGSMITAELALEQNREIFAVPHSLENKSGTGCNYLIKKGACKLVQHTDDVLEELPGEIGRLRVKSADMNDHKPEKPEPADLSGLSVEEKAIYLKLEKESAAVQIDKLAEQLSVPVSRLHVHLLQLEMKGMVVQRAGKYFELR